MRYIAKGRQERDALFFVGGVDTSKVPFMLNDEQYRWAVNSVNAGGLIQTRPGYKTVMTVCNGDEDTEINPQFITIFTPTNGKDFVVVGLSGSVYAFAFNGTRSLTCGFKLQGIQFSSTVPQIFTAQAIRSRGQVNGVKTEIEPTNILIMQDGYSRAQYWDGVGTGTLNPETLIQGSGSGDTIYADGWNQTPVGTAMAWSGNRLWVVQGNKVLASDINDPLYFTEDKEFLGGSGGIFFDSPITAILDRGASGNTEGLLFVWTATDTYTIRSGVLTRSTWETTTDFVRRVFSAVGCIAPKSPRVHQGLLYWYSEDGVQSFDSFATVTSTQRLPVIDGEMTAVKNRILNDRTLITSGNNDSYVWWSVPVGETIQGLVRNSHTHVLDTAVMDGEAKEAKAWQGIWTGINPVEWTTAIIDGASLSLALSLDNDGKVRIWEAFQGNRADNGHEIPWAVETKTHVGSTIFETSKFNYFNALLTNIVGNLKMEAFWKGTRGIYKKLMDATYTASPGSLFLESDDIQEGSLFQEYGAQSRTIQSPSLNVEVDGNCSAASVESDLVDNRDIGFSLLFKFQGRGGLSAYGIRMDALNDNSTGGYNNSESQVSNVETGLHIKPLADCPRFVAGQAAFIGQYKLPEESSKNAFNAVTVTFCEDKYSAPVDDENCVDLNSIPGCYLDSLINWTLTVINGNGSGNYQEGAVVNVSATIPSGQVFVNWTGDVSYVTDVNDATTFVTMPAGHVTITANFAPVPLYTLTVIDGSGSGSYAAGTVVPVGALIPSGYEFVNWTGDVAHVNDVDLAAAEVTMPAANITIRSNVQVASYPTPEPSNGEFILRRNFCGDRIIDTASNPAPGSTVNMAVNGEGYRYAFWLYNGPTITTPGVLCELLSNPGSISTTMPLVGGALAVFNFKFSYVNVIVQPSVVSGTYILSGGIYTDDFTSFYNPVTIAFDTDSSGMIQFKHAAGDVPVGFGVSEPTLISTPPTNYTIHPIGTCTWTVALEVRKSGSGDSWNSVGVLVSGIPETGGIPTIGRYLRDVVIGAYNDETSNVNFNQCQEIYDVELRCAFNRVPTL